MTFSPLTNRSACVLVIRFGVLAFASCGVAFFAAPAHAQRTNPFAPPSAKVQYAPDREYDLRHVSVTLNVDYPNKTFAGYAVNSLAPLRAPGLSDVRLHCGAGLTISACDVDGKPAPFKRDGEFLVVTLPAPLAQNKETKIGVRYTGGKARAGGFGDGGGFHWVVAPQGDSNPDRVGFWTQGETNFNRQWVPTWDYPNDFATSETIVTVPNEWNVVGNGVLVSEKEDKGAKTRTFHWRMAQPHATYLLSLVGGPMEIKKATWEGIPLWYTVPKGRGDAIDASFSDTPEMLSFFSRTFGVKFPWPKYAQNAVYDFGGGMENVSSTTLGENSLADARSGFRPMASLNSHELAHQWFGDLVTCRDWGQAWLNEGWATFGEKLYMEYSRGHWQYDRDIDDDMGAYFGEARRYQRPIATNVYTSPDDMFDSHAYPKGGAILHTFRRLLGDEAFFKGVQLYLTRNRHSPVESVDLERALTEASGINMKPAFDQWVYKPGHPVLDYGYTYDETKRALTVTVKQTQNTENGTPVYDIPAKIGVIVNGKVERFPFRLNVKEQTATFTLFGKPDAVLLDPDHDFLREIPKLPYLTKAANENDSELIAIARYAPNATDRARAFARMLTGSPSERVIAAAVEIVQTDTDNFPAIVDLGPLVRLRREALRPVFRSQLTQVNVERQAWGVSGLAALPANDEDRKRVEGFINDKAPYTLVVASVNALGAWKSADSVPLLQKALAMPSRREVVRQAALEALARVSPQEGERAIVQAFEPNKPQNLRQAALSAAGNLPPSPQTQALFRSALKDKAWLVVLSAATAVANQGDKTLLPDVQAAQNNLPPTAPRWVAGAISSAATRLEKGQTVPSGESGGEGN